MGLPLNKRDFDIFLSHAHKDREYVDALDNWLTEKAGLKVWYDQRELAGGSLLASDLQGAIERCRGILLIVSDGAMDQGWVKKEYNSAMDEQSNQDGFRVVALRIDGADTSNLMKGITWIDVPKSGLDLTAASALVRAFYPGDKRPEPKTARDVFISCSWRRKDAASATAACRSLVKQGFRLIGDARDQKGFAVNDRVERIISSCGGFVGIIPYRDVAEARADDGPYKYFLRELDVARSTELPSVVIADPRVRRADGSDDSWLRMETESAESADVIEGQLADLWDDWHAPPTPHYIFCAMDLESDAVKAHGPVRHVLERITGMPTVVGTDIHEDPLHSAIMESIKKAFLVLADISDDNINCCIEAGMALAAGTNVEIVARGKPRRPPFMLRSLQLSTYEDDVDQLGLIHRIARPYRRRVINAEL
jgi:hypothetical protein